MTWLCCSGVFVSDLKLVLEMEIRQFGLVPPSWMTGKSSLVISERVNIKTVVSRKQSTQNFPKMNISYPLICMRTCAYKGVRNVRFSENLACFAVLQIVAGHRSLPTIWVSWSVKIDADFLKWPSIINV